MAKEEIVETKYGKTHRFDVVKKMTGGLFGGNAEFYVRRDGSRFKGPYSDLRRAVEVAEESAR